MTNRTQNLATFGRGKYTVKFMFWEVPEKKVAVTYKAETRKGMTRILRSFLGAIRTVARLNKKGKLDEISRTEPNYTYKWLAIKCPTVEIVSWNKTGELKHTKEYKFNYHFSHPVTFRSVVEYLREQKGCR